MDELYKTYENLNTKMVSKIGNTMFCRKFLAVILFILLSVVKVVKCGEEGHLICSMNLICLIINNVKTHLLQIQFQNSFT